MVTLPAILPEVLAAAALLAGAAAEVFHARRVQRVAALAFGPRRRPAAWTVIAAPLRVVSLAAALWALASLYTLPPRVHEAAAVERSRIRHVVLVLDVSPSMKLKDAGPDKKQTRSERAAMLMESFFQRVPMEQVRLSVVATYNGAKPVVVDTKDVSVVRNILSGLPLSHAFDTGKTQLFSGLKEAAVIAKKWPRNSTTVVVISDGDTVPATGMPEMPPSVNEVAFIGVGDSKAGSFIDGHQSRQDAATLKQMAIRTKGSYHDGNANQMPTDLLNTLTAMEAESVFKRLTRREYALMALGAAASILAALPWLLMRWGTAWQPGVRVKNSDSNSTATVSASGASFQPNTTTL